MPQKDLASKAPPEKPTGEGWLVNVDQQRIVQFRPETPTTHGEWVALRTYRWNPPHPAQPMTSRRMLRHNAIEAWTTMLKTGWRRCSPPLR
jgi:hypothetical protein